MAISEDWLEAYGDVALSEEETAHRSCISMATNAALMEAYPVFRSLLSDLERETGARLAESSAYAEEEPVTIPVVVHVVWHRDVENISKDQIDSQIAVLNADYSATNPDLGNVPAVWAALPGDSGIRFRLANRDPDGAPHSGVTRTQTDRTMFPSDDSVKSTAAGGADAWPADRYLNIWVCNLQPWLGYAQFPGGPPATDGVVIGYRWFGTMGTAQAPFDLGRTATHEVAHYLNLRHIWGDTEDCSGTDHVADTPNQRLPNYNVPNFPSPSCGNGPDGDMFMNYMDYVDDRAMIMFTAGQIARMQAALRSIRVGLLTSNGVA